MVGINSITMHPVSFKLRFGKLCTDKILEKYRAREEERKAKLERKGKEYEPEYNDDDLKESVSEITWDSDIWYDVNKLVFRNDKPAAKGESLVYTTTPDPEMGDFTVRDFVEGVWRVKVNKNDDSCPLSIKLESHTEDVIDDEFIMCHTYVVDFEGGDDSDEDEEKDEEEEDDEEDD